MTQHLRALVCCIVTLAASSATADVNRIVTVDFTDARLTVQHGSTTVLETAVVLPRGDYYPLPLFGILRRGVMGPTWIPTENMHRDYPGRYQERYGPYEPGNAMGHCKLYIDFDRADEYPILNTVRIHGNAQLSDLGKRRSRSCIRIPDRLCRTLVDTTDVSEGPVLIRFVR